MAETTNTANTEKGKRGRGLNGRRHQQVRRALNGASSGLLPSRGPEKPLPIFSLPLDPTGRFAEIVPIADPHVGHVDHDQKTFYEVLNLIDKVPHIRWVDVGDNTDCTDFRPNYLGASMTIPQQFEAFGQDVRRIVKKLLVAVEGNHEARLTVAAKDGIPWYKWFWQSLGAKKAIIAKPDCEITFIARVGNIDYSLCVMHTLSGAVKDKFRAHKQSESVRLVDIFIAGHNHQLGAREKRMFMPSFKYRCWYRQLYGLLEVASGSFLRDPGYTKQKNYPVPAVGSLILRLHADSHRVEALDPYTEYGHLMNADEYKSDKTYRLSGSSP